MEKTVVYCDMLFKDQYKFPSDFVIFTSTPIACLETSETVNPNMIIIHFPCSKIDNRSRLLELCVFLKENRLTRDVPVVALIKYYQSPLLLKLENTGIEYVAFWDEKISLEEKINEIGKGLHELLSPEEHLALSCPYLLYENDFDCDEIILCKAYKSRLVINSLRLDTLCSSKNHEKCDYFMNPRLKP